MLAKLKPSFFLVALLALLLGGCMTKALALKFGEQTGRFKIVDQSALGSDYASTIAMAEKAYAIQPRCESEKGGVSMIKKAVTMNTCVFAPLTNTFMAGQKVVSATYVFIDSRFEQLDLEIELSSDDGQQAIIAEISSEIAKEAETEGPMTIWRGESDTTLLVRQGNVKIRMTNNILLPENMDYSKVTPRQE